MEKLHYDQEINRLFEEVKRLEKDEQLGYDTAVFLDKESKKLESIIINENLPDDEREDASKKLEILQNKILSEIKHMTNNDVEMLRIESELQELIKKI